MTLSKLACSCIVLFALAITALAANTYTTIDYPGQDVTFVTGVNNAGDMVGGYSDIDGPGHSFMLSEGAFINIDPPGAISAVAYGINDSKQFVGSYRDGELKDHGFLFDGVNYVEIAYPGASRTVPNGINNNGEIVGQCDFPRGASGGFLLKDGVYTTLKPPKNNGPALLTGINNPGSIVGIASGGGPVSYYGFRYGNGEFKPIEFPDAYITVPNGLNDNGVIVGYFVARNPVTKLYETSCFAFVNYRTQRIRFPGALNEMECLGINNSGQVVGYYNDSRHLAHGFLITPDN
jgi:uncharacterized membrane protein